MLLSSMVFAFNTSAQQVWFTPLNSGLFTFLDSSSNLLFYYGRYDDVFFVSHDTGFVVSAHGMIFKTYDGAAHWHLKKDIGSTAYCRSVEFSSNGQFGIVGTLNGLVFRSQDRGETWDDISLSLFDTGVQRRRLCGLAHYEHTFFGVGWWGAHVARFYKSVDAGITWTTSYLDTNLVSGLVDVVFLSATKGFVTGFHSYGAGKQESVVLRTLDGGDTWAKVFSDTTIAGGIWKIQFIDDSVGVGSIEPLYIDTVAMIKTTDGGNTWQLHSVGHKAAWTWGWGTQGVGFLNRQKGWVGGYYDGMFETNDGGLTWDSVTTNKECDRFFRIDSTMYLSANTVYKYGIPGASSVGSASTPTYLHKLYPVKPNPANGNVTIEFDVNAHPTNVVLKVVNTDGRRTYPVMQGYLEPGHYSYKWDGTSEPAGNYIIWLGMDEIPMVQKFVLSK